jgi:hypothetical protein
VRIYIPTRDRVNAQYTWENLTPALRKHTTLVCPAKEVQAHTDRSRVAVARPPVPLAGVRQWLVDEAVADGRGDEPIIMLDDDLCFFVRKDQSAHNLRPAGPDVDFIMRRLINLVLESANDYNAVVHAGLSPRQGNNWSWPATTERNSRMNAVHCILPDAFHHYNVRYDAVDMMEDYHVTLSLFEAGEDNVAITDAAWDQVKGSGAPGGFSHYRTNERQADAAHKLAELHPDSVKVVTKNPSTGAGGFAGPRTDVRVQWKKARKLGLNSTFVRGVVGSRNIARSR